MRRNILIGLVGAVAGVLLSTLVVLAGGLDPGSGPTEAGSQMFTLEDIYNRLATGAAGTKSTSFTEPSTGPTAGTGHTLDQVMAAAPASDDTSGATPGEVANGKTYYSLKPGAWGLQTGTGQISVFPGPVSQTGQTQCYKSASPWETCTCGDADCPSGQDGDFESGVSWPNPRFTDHSDGTVTDNLTGLIWLKNANCPDGSRDWVEAYADVAELNSSGTMWTEDCGDISNGGVHQTDWRLPNMEELFSLVHYGVYNPAVANAAGTGKWSDGDPFTNIDPYYYWTSTTSAGYAQYAWSVSLYDGGVGYLNKTSSYAVWPVRGGQ